VNKSIYLLTYYYYYYKNNNITYSSCSIFL